MLPWIIVITVVIIVNFSGNQKRINIIIGEKKRSVDLIGSTILVFLIVFRAARTINVGGDLLEYNRLYNYIGRLPWKRVLTANPGYETGWLVLNKVLNYVSEDFQIVLLFISIINTVAFFWFSFNYSADPWLTIYIYIAFGFWGSSFNNERQTLATGILLFSLYYVQHRKPIKFLFLIMLATSFHATSLVYIVVYFLYGKFFKKKQIVLVLGLTTLVYLFATPILNIAMKVLPFYFAKYGNAEWLSGHGYGYFVVLATLGISTVILYRYDNNKENNLFIYMLFLATILQVISFRMGYFQRLVKLFSVSMTIYLPLALLKLKTGISRTAGKIVIILVLLLFYISSLMNDTISLVPYEWIFN